MAILRLEVRYEGRDPVEGGLRCGAVARPGGDSAQTRRLLALGVIYDGHCRSDAARFAGVGLQIIWDWVLRFNAEGPEGLKNREAPGPPYKLNEEQRAALAAIVESGPDPEIHGVVRWRRCDLAAWLKEQCVVGRDDSWAGAAPDGLCEAVRSSTSLCPGRSWQRLKNFSERLKEIRAALGEDVEIEVWWQDEARVGQKNKITRAKRGTRPSAPKDQRTTSAYIFICPEQGQSCWPRHALCQHGSTERPSQRDRLHR